MSNMYEQPPTAGSDHQHVAAAAAAAAESPAPAMTSQQAAAHQAAHHAPQAPQAPHAPHRAPDDQPQLAYNHVTHSSSSGSFASASPATAATAAAAATAAPFAPSLPPPQLHQYSPHNFPYSPTQTHQQVAQAPGWPMSASPLTPRNGGTGPARNEAFELSPNAARIPYQQPPQQQQQAQQQAAASSGSGFRNPWGGFNPNLAPLQPQGPGTGLSVSPSSSRLLPSLNTFHLQQSPQPAAAQLQAQQAQQTSALLQPQNASRASFSHNLPTTYEYDNMTPHILPPPSRAAAPGPSSYYNDHEVSLLDLTRRSSVAVPSYGHHPDHQFPVTRRASLFTANSIYQQQAQNVVARPAPKIRRIARPSDLKPHVNAVPKFRRASTATTHISPLAALTTALSSTFTICRPEYSYKSSRNPRRVLTKPNEGKFNDGYDNEESDYILYVNDVLGVQENKKYMVLDILGQGTFGQVVKCQDLKTQELVAVKIVKSQAAYLNQSLTEVNILEALNTQIDPFDRHHFLRLKDKFVHRNHLCIVLELLSSNLYELIKQNSFNGLQMKLLRNFTVQLLDSLSVLKDARIIHCDLKPENILLVSPDRPELKMIDFGSACKERQTIYTYIQSRFYRCPEVMLGIAYSTSIDMWSLGCIVAELFLGLPLFPGTSEYNQLQIIIDMLGMPPNWMCDMGKNSAKFLNKVTDDQGATRYELKSPEQYMQEQNVVEKKPKKYFADTRLPDIIMNYTMPKKATRAMLEKEVANRKLLVDFLTRCLDMNPLTRWSPQEAREHPLIKGVDPISI